MVEEKNIETRRSFLGPNGETKHYVASPTADDIRGADWEYSKQYTRSLVEGITTSAEMMDILMRRGIVGPEFEQRANELAVDLGDKIDQLNLSTSDEEKRELSIDVSTARDTLFQWNQRLNGPMSNTCEQLSDNSKLEFITFCITQNEEGEKVWDSYDSYLLEKNDNLAIQARFEVMLYLQGLDSDFLDKTPEATAMREVEENSIKMVEEAVKAAEVIMKEEAAQSAEVENDPALENESKPKVKKTSRKRTKTKK